MSNPDHEVGRTNQILHEEVANWQRLRDASADQDPWDSAVVDADLQKWHRMRELATDSALATEELVRQARETDDPDVADGYVQILHYRGTREVLEAAHRLCQDPVPGARSLGADILGQLGGMTHPFPTEAGDALLAILITETHPVVLRAIGRAFFNLHDERALEPLLALQQHSDPDVRVGVAQDLTSVEDPWAIHALITLSGDSNPEVREWATFGLA